MIVAQSVLDTEYVLVPVAAVFNGALYNPTGDAVAFAFMVSGNPGVSDWHTGEWENTGVATYAARCLVGPANGGVALPVGTYSLWVKITDAPEIPVNEVGILSIT
jgi:hypothetical protein